MIDNMGWQISDISRRRCASGLATFGIRLRGAFRPTPRDSFGLHYMADVGKMSSSSTSLLAASHKHVGLYNGITRV